MKETGTKQLENRRVSPQGYPALRLQAVIKIIPRLGWYGYSQKFAAGIFSRCLVNDPPVLKTRSIFTCIVLAPCIRRISDKPRNPNASGVQLLAPNHQTSTACKLFFVSWFYSFFH